MTTRTDFGTIYSLRMTFLYILLTVFHLVNSKEYVPCDFDKVCHSCKNRTLFILNCSRRNISTIPIIPIGAQVVNLKFNKLEIIRNGTFKKLQNLTELDLSFNQLVELETDAFVGLNSLQKLSLQNNTLGYSFLSFPESVFTPLVSLENLNIKFNSKPTEEKFLESVIFDKHMPTLETLEIDVLFPINSTDSGIFLLNITSLKTLITGICMITELQEATFEYVENLEYMDLSSCPINTYKSNTLLYRNIRYMDLSNSHFLADDASFSAFMSDIKTCTLGTLVLSNTTKANADIFHARDFISILFKNLFFTEIRKLRLSNNYFFEIEWQIDENFKNSLDMEKWGSFHIKTNQHAHGVPSSLQILDLSHNSLFRFAYPIENVLCLNLSHNWIREIEYGAYVNNIGTGLKELDLSFNFITNLAQFTFPHYSLEKMILSNNEIDEITFNFEHLTNLKVLDLSNNRIESFKQKSMDILSHLMKSKNFSLNLENNNLQCTCDTLNFLRWMQSNLQHFHNNHLYKCQFEDGNILVLNNLDSSITQLERQCLHLTGVIVCTSLGIFITCIIIAIKLVYRNRWIVLYYYYLKKSKDLNTSESTELKEGFIYDAFVAYAENDRDFVLKDCIKNLETNKNLKLCINHRDFMPGEDITVNITNAIHRSRKTICIITKSFLESYYCMFEFNMAITEGIYSRKGENTIILVFYEEILLRDLPLVLLQFVQRRSYIPYSDDQRGNIEFWDRIKEAICGREMEVRIFSISSV